MQKIKFLKNNCLCEVSLSFYYISETKKRIKCVFNLESEIPESNVLLGGFVELNEHNEFVQGDFSNFTTLYRVMDDGLTYIFSNTDGDIYVEPIPTVTFVANDGGSLEGELVQKPSNYEELVTPIVKPNENYKFVKWNPEIPVTGEITSDITFHAEFEYVPTEEELQYEYELVKQNKINELSASCENTIYNGVMVGDVNYSYTMQDQSNLVNSINVAKASNMSVPYHADGMPCSLYTLEDLMAIYIAEQMNITRNQTYFNQMKLYINSLSDRNNLGLVSNLFYGSELQGEYLNNYNAIMEQSDKIVNTIVSNKVAV